MSLSDRLDFPLDRLLDVRAQLVEQLTDEELAVGRLSVDLKVHGLCAIDSDGNRIDPRNLIRLDK